MGIDRSKFKATPVAALKKQDAELGQRRGYANYERTGFHSIDQGDNKFRIYPAHPESKSPAFMVPKSTVWLSVTTDLYDDDGEKTGEQEIKRRPIFTSDVHGPKDLAGVDLVKSYIKYAEKRFSEQYETEEEIKTAKGVLTHYKTGLSIQLKYVMYADKYLDNGQKTCQSLEISNAVKKQLNELASEMDPEDGAIQVDPFTDPEDGIAIIINKTGQKLETKYKVDLEKKKTGKLNFSLVPTPLSDDDLEAFMKLKPLEKKFINTFKRRDFELQKEGLMRFDEESEFNFFAEEEWIEQVEEIQELVFSVIGEDGETPDDSTENELPFESEEEHKAKVKAKVSGSIKKAPKVEEEEEDDYEEEEEPEENPSKSTKTESIKERLARLKAERG